VDPNPVDNVTLLVTEIHNHRTSSKARIVFAADRRVTRNGQYAGTQKKVFEIPYLNAGLGYFGLAAVAERPMAEWLRNYLRRETKATSLAGFSTRLAEHLNSDVPRRDRTRFPSGFHIAGFDTTGRAEFWFVRNIRDDGICVGNYTAREDFQRRDAASLAPGHYQIYRNGDLRPHVLLWESLDEALVPLLAHRDFRRVQTPDEYTEWVKFKMEIIAYVYKKYCKQSLIGRRIDAFCLTRSGRV
jgi:hypothetical protein